MMREAEMDGRARILDALREVRLDDVPLPDLDIDALRAPDGAATAREDAFISMLESVGGTGVQVPDLARANKHLESLPWYRQAARVASTVTGLGRSDVDLDRMVDPHAIDGIDVAVVKADFGVAENGAVWLRGDSVPHRALFFLVTHLVAVVERSALVRDMHEAYERVAMESFGVFVSGPSKTADIEQALVLGAHGPVTMTVYLVG
jgi:L-lactate dehydrogenase complex protein LldG